MKMSNGPSQPRRNLVYDVTEHVSAIRRGTRMHYEDRYARSASGVTVCRVLGNGCICGVVNLQYTTNITT